MNYSLLFEYYFDSFYQILEAGLAFFLELLEEHNLYLIFYQEEFLFLLLVLIYIFSFFIFINFSKILVTK